MSPITWTSFADEVDNLCSKYQILTMKNPSASKHNLNRIWSELSTCIIQAAKSHISNTKDVGKCKLVLPSSLVASNADLRFLARLKTKLSHKKINSSSKPIS